LPGKGFRKSSGSFAMLAAIRRASSTRFLIFVKAQSSRFDIIALSSSGSQLKGPPNGGLLFAFPA
jgi:hypothetical protein